MFHVWCRAIDDMHVFPEPRDKREFLERFERHLSRRVLKDRTYRPYRKLHDEVEVLAINVLDNHYHLVILQKRPGGLIKLMAAVLTAYGHYFNKTHGRRAQIFESPYSVRIAEDLEDQRRLIGYVHANHEVIGLNYEFSSHRDYVGEPRHDWISVRRGRALFVSRADYDRRMEEALVRAQSRKPAERAARQTDTRRIRRGPGSHIRSEERS